MDNQRELDKIIESYFNEKNRTDLPLNLEMLVEMIENSYPDHGAGGKPDAFEQQISPEMIANQLPPGEITRGTVEKVVAQVMGEFDVAMVDAVMLHVANPQGLGDRPNVQTMHEENEKKTGRFSYKLSIPALVPSEAWGDPKHMSRKTIDRVFNVIRKKDTMQKSIALVNSFIDPQQAASKAPGGRFHTVINMMQIIEALQATLNDYTESSAGFVFEGFMAALTGGVQIADRIGGTLPIEDFKTYNDEQVSLKLLSPGTNIHGSFTNLLDYLYLREGGNEKIKYLIAYKNSKEDDVSELLIYDFLITQKNFAAVMEASGNADKFGDSLKSVTIPAMKKVKDEAGKVALEPVLDANNNPVSYSLPSLPGLLKEYTPGGTDDWRARMKLLLTHGVEVEGKNGKMTKKAHVPGYTGAGMFYSDEIVTSTGGMLKPKEADAAAAVKKAEKATAKQGDYRMRSHGQYEIAALKDAKESALKGVPEEEAWSEFLGNHEDLNAVLRPHLKDDASEEENKRADRTAKTRFTALRNKFMNTYTDTQQADPPAMSESYFGSFHERERVFLKEQQLLVESGKKSKEDAGSQWSISGPAMMKMANIMDTTFYGELNLSAENIDKCADIYIDKMKGDMIILLDTTKAFTENVGKYFGEPDRDKAGDFAEAAKTNAKTVTSKLSADMDSDPKTDK